jgi:hypothetical protein
VRNDQKERKTIKIKIKPNQIKGKGEAKKNIEKAMKFVKNKKSPASQMANALKSRITIPAQIGNWSFMNRNHWSCLISNSPEKRGS